MAAGTKRGGGPKDYRGEKELKEKKEEMEKEFLMENGSELAKRMAAWQKEGDELTFFFSARISLELC